MRRVGCYENKRTRLNGQFIKGYEKDRQQREQIQKREKARRDTQDINEFMATLAAICPEYYGGSQ